jgi:hypothetical protein
MKVQGTNKLVVLAVALAVLLTAAPNLHACEFDLALNRVNDQSDLMGGEGARPVSLESHASLHTGYTYDLTITYREDHRNCRVPPEDTVFLLQDARWRTGRETQGLVLLADIVWSTVDTGRHAATLRFRVVEPGEYRLQIIRVCPRSGGGYDETFVITAG